MIIIVVVIIVGVCLAIAQACSSEQKRGERKARSTTVTPPAQRQQRQILSEQRVMAITCECGKLNNTSEKECWGCNKPLASLEHQLHTFDPSSRCSICAYYLFSGDHLVITPCCFSQGHTEHLQDWVRAKGSCPSCEASIKPAHLLRVLPPDWRPPSRRWKPLEQKVVVLVCECGKANNPTETTCWSCAKALSAVKRETQIVKSTPSCVACGYELTPSELIAICPNCHCQGHKTHLLALIKAKGKCPTCGQRLRTSHLLVSKPHTTHHPRQQPRR